MLKDTLLARIRSLEKPVEVDVHLVEFNDVRYCIQASAKEPQYVLISVALPQAPPEVVTSEGLPFGALEAIAAAYGPVVQPVQPPESGFNLTIRFDIGRLSSIEEERLETVSKLASIRSVIMGAPLRQILRALGRGRVYEGADLLTAVMHKPNESYFVSPQAEKVTVVYPMRFSDPNDAILANAFLQEFIEARRMVGLSIAPSCSYSHDAPLELKGAPRKALDANAGFVSFVIFQRHVEGSRLEKTAWCIQTFHAYVAYHIKCSKAFMHTRMRRRVDSLIQVLNRAKPEGEKEKKTAQGRTFKRPSGPGLAADVAAESLLLGPRED